MGEAPSQEMKRAGPRGNKRRSLTRFFGLESLFIECWSRATCMGCLVAKGLEGSGGDPLMGWVPAGHPAAGLGQGTSYEHGLVLR